MNIFCLVTMTSKQIKSVFYTSRSFFSNRQYSIYQDQIFNSVAGRQKLKKKRAAKTIHLPSFQHLSTRKSPELIFLLFFSQFLFLSSREPWKMRHSQQQSIFQSKTTTKIQNSSATANAVGLCCLGIQQKIFSSFKASFHICLISKMCNGFLRAELK